MPTIRMLLEYGEPKNIDAKDYAWRKIWGASDLIAYGKLRDIAERLL